MSSLLLILSSLELRGEIPLEPLKKAVFFNFILLEWKRSKSGFFAHIRRHYLTSKNNFFMIEKYKMAEIWRIPSIASLLTFFAAVNFLARFFIWNDKRNFFTNREAFIECIAGGFWEFRKIWYIFMPYFYPCFLTWK